MRNSDDPCLRDYDEYITSMTSRFPGPWRIAEFPNGFAVYDATGQQLGFFYGRTDSNTAGHTGFVMIDETDCGRFRKAAGTAQADLGSKRGRDFPGRR